MKKLFVAFAACAMLISCGNKPATEEQTEEEQVVVEEVAEPAAEEAVVEEVAPAVDNTAAEIQTLIDQYVKACDEENEIEAGRIAKRIDSEYKDKLSSNDVERMTAASAVLAEKRANQAKDAANKISDGLKKMKKD